MGYAQALLAKDTASERAKLEKQASKKGLFGSIGRTLGGIAAMGLTAGMVNPLTIGLITGGMSAAGGAIGASQAKIKGGKFFQSERADLKSRLGGLGSENIMGSLTSGLTAGMGAKLKVGNKLMEADYTTGLKGQLARGYGLGGEQFAQQVTRKGLADNPWLLDEASELSWGIR